VLDALLNDDGSANILDNKNRCEKHGDDFRHNETVYDVCKNNFTDESSDEFKKCIGEMSTDPRDTGVEYRNLFE
jgi:hypothetical protein